MGCVCLKKREIIIFLFLNTHQIPNSAHFSDVKVSVTVFNAKSFNLNFGQ